MVNAKTLRSVIPRWPSRKGRLQLLSKVCIRAERRFTGRDLCHPKNAAGKGGKKTLAKPLPTDYCKLCRIMDGSGPSCRAWVRFSRLFSPTNRMESLNHVNSS
jgi:hypothetical protein